MPDTDIVVIGVFVYVGIVLAAIFFGWLRAGDKL